MSAKMADLFGSAGDAFNASVLNTMHQPKNWIIDMGGRSCINHYGLKSQGFVYAVRDRAAVMRVRENPTLQKCFHRDGYVEYRLDGHKTKAKVSK